ncbi:hypothetical protein TNCV_3675011 [Trichonephila clavipes]|nr:hypothetical protein TNCV_3675011 [Trichonephila clavipes]
MPAALIIGCDTTRGDSRCSGLTADVSKSVVSVIPSQASTVRWWKVPLAASARGLLTTDHVILNHGQVTWMTPELAPLSPNYHTTPTGKRFNSQQI